MKTPYICPSCHSETRRLTYCVVTHRMVCAESCALTNAEIFLLDLTVTTDHNVAEEIAPAAQLTNN